MMEEWIVMIKNGMLCLVTLACGAGMGPVYAADSLLQACRNEIEKFACDAMSPAYAYDCLSRHKEDRIKDKGFRSRCFKAYRAYEKANGKGEKVESHQVERLEHAN
jgi:hypothetical protein